MGREAAAGRRVAAEAASAGEFVEGVAGAPVGPAGAGGFPVAVQEGAAEDTQVVLRAEVVKIGEGEGISGAAFKPLGGVNGVAGFAAAEEEVEAVDPEAVIDEADGDDAADAEGFVEDGGGLVEFFEGAGADDVVEVGGGELAHEVHHVALVGGHAAADAGGDFGDVEVNADGGDLFGLGEGFEEDAATAAEIEHAGARRHQIGDDLLIDGAFDGEFGHGGRRRRGRSELGFRR